MKFDEIKPVGNFKEILEKFRVKTDEIIAECHSLKKYTPRISKLIKLIVTNFDLISVLEEAIEKKDVWNKKEAIICLLYTHLLIIYLNDTAQLYLNNIKMDSPIKQLQEHINSKPKIFGKLKLEE